MTNLASKVEAGSTRYIPLPHQKEGAVAVFWVQVRGWQYYSAAPSTEKVYWQVCINLSFLCLNSRRICAQKLAAVSSVTYVKSHEILR